MEETKIDSKLTLDLQGYIQSDIINITINTLNNTVLINGLSEHDYKLKIHERKISQKTYEKQEKINAEFREVVKTLWRTLQENIKPVISACKIQIRIEELEKILHKNPNRTDLRMELMSLRKLVKPNFNKRKKLK